MYEMCSGHRAFSTEDNDWLDRLLHREPKPISNFSSETPPELERIVRKAIAKRPDERYQSATELLTDLKTLRRKMESGSDPDPARDWDVQPQPKPAPASPRDRVDRSRHSGGRLGSHRCDFPSEATLGPHSIGNIGNSHRPEGGRENPQFHRMVS